MCRVTGSVKEEPPEAEKKWWEKSQEQQETNYLPHPRRSKTLGSLLDQLLRCSKEKRQEHMQWSQLTWV